MSDSKHWTQSNTIRALGLTGLGVILAIAGLVAHNDAVIAAGLGVVSIGTTAAGAARAGATQPLTRRRPQTETKETP